MPSTGFSHAVGLDVIFPGFFVLLLFDALRARTAMIPVSVLPGLGAALWLRPRGRSHLLAIVVTALFRLVTGLITKS